MKKVLALIMMFALVSVSSAAVKLATDKLEYMPGETVVVSIVGDEVVNNFSLRTLSATPNNGVASVGTVYEGFNFGVINGEGALANDGDALYRMTGAEAISGQNFALIPGGSDCPAGTALYSFEYVLSQDAPLGDVQLTTDGIANGAPIAAGVFTVVPEPMTMSLLGLGGLALIRRRRNA